MAPSPWAMALAALVAG
ncbi:hypothetical protein [Janthinobacterium sp. 61]